MSTSRMAPLWRSSGRCLALRPRATTAAATATLAARQSTAASPAAVRSYSNATTGSNEPATGNTQNTGASVVSQGAASSSESAKGDSYQVNTVDPVVERLAKLEAARKEALQQLGSLTKGKAGFDVAKAGHKYGLTTAATRASTMKRTEGDEDFDLSGGELLPVVGKLQKRHDPVIFQLTRLLMRDGKLGKAERVCRARPPKSCFFSPPSVY